MAPVASPPGRRSRRRRRGRRRSVVAAGGAALLVAALAAGVGLATSGGGGHERVAAVGAPVAPSAPAPNPTTLVPSPDAVLPPATPEATVATLVRVERAIRGDDRDPAQLRVLGWEQQLAVRELSNHADGMTSVLGALPTDVRPWVQANLDAGSALSSLTPPQAALPDWTILSPPSADILRGYYAEAERATGISWAYLAAIHLLETRMGRIHGTSTAGAQGPMQFIPSTWAAYGNGGDINRAHDAILAAARYLKAAGGPDDMNKAIYAYNHDLGYVSAVKDDAANLLADPRAYDGYYQWQVYYRTIDGAVWLPEGYAPTGPIGARPLPSA